MSEQFTVEVSESTARLVRQMAAQTGQNPDSILSAIIDRSLTEMPVDALADREVLALADMMMNDADGEELGDLLDDQREDQLDPTKRARLDELLQSYRRGMVRKSEALKVAVQRGLRPPLE